MNSRFLDDNNIQKKPVSSQQDFRIRDVLQKAQMLKDRTQQRLEQLTPEQRDSLIVPQATQRSINKSMQEKLEDAGLIEQEVNRRNRSKALHTDFNNANVMTNQNSYLQSDSDISAVINAPNNMGMVNSIDTGDSFNDTGNSANDTVYIENNSADNSADSDMINSSSITFDGNSIDNVAEREIFNRIQRQLQNNVLYNDEVGQNTVINAPINSSINTPINSSISANTSINNLTNDFINNPANVSINNPANDSREGEPDIQPLTNYQYEQEHKRSVAEALNDYVEGNGNDDIDGIDSDDDINGIDTNPNFNSDSNSSSNNNSNSNRKDMPDIDEETVNKYNSIIHYNVNNGRISTETEAMRQLQKNMEPKIVNRRDVLLKFQEEANQELMKMQVEVDILAHMRSMVEDKLKTSYDTKLKTAQSKCKELNTRLSVIANLLEGR